jgi:CheY-like chemotaxis protein
VSTVLVVDSDLKARSAIAAMVRGLGHRVLEAEAGAALRLLRQGEVEVLLAEMPVGVQGGADLLRQAVDVSPSTRCILTAQSATAEEYKSAISRGAVDVLSLPVDADQLETSIRRALESTGGFHGSLHGLDLLDILQMLNRARRSTIVCIGEKAEVMLREGEIVHASCPGFAGRPALRQILMAKSGSIDTRPYEDCAQTIEQRFDGLLLDLMREIDEHRAGRKSAPHIAAERGEPNFEDLGIFADESGPSALAAPFSSAAAASPAASQAAAAAPPPPRERRPAPSSRPLPSVAGVAQAENGAIQGELRPQLQDDARGLLSKPAFWGAVVVLALLAGGVLFVLLSGDPPKQNRLEPVVRPGATPDASAAMAKPLTSKPTSADAAVTSAKDAAATQVATPAAHADQGADEPRPKASARKTSRSRAAKRRARKRGSRKARSKVAGKAKTPQATPKAAPPKAAPAKAPPPKARRPAIGTLD